MKIFPALIVSWAILSGRASAQLDIPPPPGYPGKPRRTGSAEGGVQVTPRDESRQVTKYTTRIMLSAPRSWTSTDGKIIEGRLIAFEDLVVEAPKGGAAPSPSEPPKNPTVVREGRIRLQLSDPKVVEVPLTRLAESDRKFVEQIQQTFAGKAPQP